MSNPDDSPPVVVLLRVENGYIVQVNQHGAISQYVARDALGAVEIAAQQYGLDVQVFNAP